MTISSRLTLIRVFPAIFEEVLPLAPYKGPPTYRTEGLLYHAELDLHMGDTLTAVARYDTIRALLKPVVESDSHNIKAVALISLAYSGLGRHREATEMAKRGVELQPVSKDAYFGTAWLTTLAIVQMRAGQHEAALDQLEYLLSIPSGISVGLLHHDPIWDPLRKYPRFEHLLESPPVEGS